MKRPLIWGLLLCLLLSVFLTAYALNNKKTVIGDASAQSGEEPANIDIPYDPIPLTAGIAASEVSAVASGVSVESSGNLVLDYSNTADGYIMLKYTGKNQKVKTQITGPSGVTYTYNQSLSGEYDVFILSDGNGSYKIASFENISGTSYAKAFSFSIKVTLKDEFAPFLRSNKYVNYSASSKVVSLAAELCKDKKNTNEKIKAVYEYAVANISYDYDLAKTVTSGYIPDLDSVLAKKKGICYDYAATMTAMLRSQGVPTKLVFGYTGKLYHAWISTFSPETGWVTASIYFDGKDWLRMDPTFASTGKSSNEITKYISNENNYVAKYFY